MIVRHRFAAFALCCHAALLLTLLLLCQTPVVFGASNPPPPPNDVRLPNGRTSIKINPGLATTTAGQTPHTRATSQHQRAGAAPILFRQPNPALPPPFLNVNAAVASSPPPANTDADSTIDVTYYGDAEGDSNLEAAGSSNTAADAQALPPDETGTVHFPPQSPEATAWLELSGHCWTHTTSKYVYSFCPFQNVTQKSTTSVLHVVLGVFDEWIDQGEAPVIVAASSSDAAAQETATPTPTAAASASHDGLVMSYTDGTACGNGKRRSTRVYFLCSTEPGGTRIGDVTEPATCEYEVTFSTPLMCTPEQRAQALEAAGGESDHAIRQAMQTCINILYAHVSTPLHSRLQLPKEVRDTCVNYIPELRASYEDEDNKAAAAARAAVKPAAAGTPPATPAAVTYDSSVAAPTTDSSQPIRANIPASISQADDSAVSSAPTPSRAPPAEELSPNGDVRPEVAASPYAELDKRHSEELGCGGSKTADEYTADLWALINKRLTQYGASGEAEVMLAGGASIRQQAPNGKYMIEECREQEKRNRQANRGSEADGALKVIRMLEAKASSLVIESVRDGKLEDVKLLQRLGADMHQSAAFGMLGLLSHALKSPSTNLQLVKYLVEAHPSNRSAIGLAVTQNKPPTPLHKTVQDAATAQYLHNQLNMILLELPTTVPAGKGNDGNDAARLVEQVELLIVNGADPKVIDQGGNNVLCQAVLQGHVPLARRLLHLGVDSTYTNPSTGMSVLHLAESQSHRDPVLIALLKSHSFNLEFQSKIKAIGEQKEVEYDHWHGELQQLLTAGAEIHSLNSNQDTPFHLLVHSLNKLENQEDDSRFVQMFVQEFHADPEKYNHQGLRPIELAILGDRNLRVLRELLDASQLLNAKLNQSILVFARNAPASAHKDSTVHLIQSYMNDRLWKEAMKSNRRGKNHEAIHAEFGRLISLGADVNARTGDEEHEGYTPLCLVSQQGDVTLAARLVSVHNANPTIAADGETSTKNTPIHLASEHGQLAIVQYLRSLVLQVQLNVRNSLGETPLHLAARNGHVRIVKFLAQWGCDTQAKDGTDQTALDVARSAGAVSPSSGKKGEAQHGLVIEFLTRCEVSKVCEEKASIISQAEPELVDVCVPIRLPQVASIIPFGTEDEDPLGSQSRGLLKGAPNGNLKSAARNGNLQDAKQAVSEGADVRHRESGKCPWQWAKQERDEALQVSTNANKYETRRDAQTKAADCERVANYLVEAATNKLVEAIEQGNERRVPAYHEVGADITRLVNLAAKSTGSVPIMHYLVTQDASNMAALWNASYWPAAEPKANAPYYVAKAKKFDALAQYIQAQLSIELSKAVAAQNLPHVREVAAAGGLADLDGVENLSVALQGGDVEMVRFLLDRGARIPSARFPNLDAVMRDGNLAVTMKALLRQRFEDRAIRIAAAQGDFQAVVAYHQQGADVSASNCNGATALSLSLQFTHVPALVHYLVTRGATMLHSQVGVPSAVPLSRSQGHPANNLLEGFLKQSLNVALFNAIMEGDLVTAGALCALGAELGAQDESGNTLVHTAVAFNGIDAVKWLTERGAPLNIANAAGEYAITAATIKGDAASVEFIVRTNAGTKALKNASGKTALDLAKEARYNKLVQLMDPGNKDYPVSAEDDNMLEPSQEYDELIRASAYGQLDAIKIFIEEKYASLARKTQIAGDMVRAAEAKNQAEVLRILVPHYKSLTSETASDQTADRIVSASAEQKKILAGFLTGLSGLIAGGEVELDPSDPSTYQQLFSNLSNRQAAQTDFLAKNKGNTGELTKAASKEAQDLAGKMQKLQEEMRAMSESKNNLIKRLQANEAQLAACKTATAKKDCYAEIQEAKDQLATLSSSVALFTRAAEAAAKKKKTLDALKAQPNLLVAYSTIENRLQGLFLACKSATSGLQALNMTESGDRNMQIVSIASSLAEMIPMIGATLSKVISVGVGTIVTQMDKSRQQQEISNIVTLGNIEELNKAASNAAALVTYYYAAQINAVQVTIEKKSDNPIADLGEYLVLFMVKALRDGQIVAGMDLATQLWYGVACQDPIQPQSLVDRLLGTPGDMKVTLRTKQTVTLRALIGSVGVIAADNILYIPQAKLLAACQKAKPGFEPHYSAVYLSAFTSSVQVQALVSRRSLQPATQDESAKFLTSSSLSPEEAAKLRESAASFQEQQETFDGAVVPFSPEGKASGSTSGGVLPGGDMNKVSLQVADNLQSKGLILSRDQAKEMIQQSITDSSLNTELAVEAMREDMNTKHAHYQTSIEAATETLTSESEKLRQEHRAVQQELNKNVAKQLADQQTAFAKQQAAQNAAQEAKLIEITAKHEASLQALQDKMAAAYAELQASNAKALAKLQADAAAQLEATADAQQAALAALVTVSTTAQSEAAAARAASTKSAADAAAVAKESQANNEKWAADLAASKAGYDAALKASTDASAKTIADHKVSLDALKEAAKTSAQSAKDSQAAAAQAAKELKELRELTAKDNAQAKEIREKELKALKEQAEKDSKALIAQAKDAQKAADAAAENAKNAEKMAKKAASDAEDAKNSAAKMASK